MTYLADTSINNSLNAHRQPVGVNRLLEVDPRNKISPNQRRSIDTASILSVAVSSADTYLNFYASEYGIHDFKPTTPSNTIYRSKSHSGLVIKKGETGFYSLSHKSTPVETGNIYGILRKLHNLNPSIQDDLITLYSKIATYSGQVINPSNPYPSTIKKNVFNAPVARQEWVANNGCPLNISSEFTLGSFDSRVGKSVLSEFKDRWQVERLDLEKFDVLPLKTVTSKRTKRVQVIGVENAAYALISGQNVCLKRLKPTGKMLKQYSLQSVGNRCFGYDQLLKKGKAVFIVGGEKDVITLTAFFSRYELPMSAICLNSETATIPKALVLDLRGRFEHVCILFDNDKTGRESGEKAVLAHPSLTVLDIATLTDKKDVSDYIEFGTDNDLYEFIITELRTKIAVPKRPDDLDSVCVSSALKLDYHQYLGDQSFKTSTGLSTFDQLYKYIKDYDKLMIQAQTGAGKTYFFMLLLTLNGGQFFADNGVSKVYFCVPTIPIAEQVRSDFSTKFNKYVPLIKGESTDDDVHHAQDSNIIVVTYDSLERACIEETSNDLIIVDECHKLVVDSDYRGRATNTVFDRLPLFKKSVLISATPCLIFTKKDIDPRFNYQLVKATGEVQQRVNLNVLRYSQGERASLIGRIIKEMKAIPFKGVYIIRINNVALAEVWRKEIAKSFPLELSHQLIIETDDDQVGDLSQVGLFDEIEAREAKELEERSKQNSKLPSKSVPDQLKEIPVLDLSKSTILSSKKEQYRDLNPDYQDIISTGQVKDSLGVILATSLMDAGVSIKMPVVKVILIDPVCPYGVVQSIARARMYTDEKGRVVNAQLEVDVYKSNVKSKECNTATLSYEKSIINRFSYAQDMANVANNHISTMLSEGRKYDDETSVIRYSVVEGKYIINHLQMLNKEQVVRSKALSMRAFFEKITYEYPHLRIKKFIDIEVKRDDLVINAMSDNKKVTKEEKESGICHLSEIAKNSPMRALKAIVATTKNARTKKVANNLLKYSYNFEPVSAKVLREDKDVCTILDDTEMSTHYRNGSLKDAERRFVSMLNRGVTVEVAINCMSLGEQEYKTHNNSIVATYELEKFSSNPSAFSGRSKVRVEGSCKFIKIIREKAKNGKKQFDIDGVRAMAAKAYGDKDMSSATALMRLKELYHVDKKSVGRAKERRNVYTIVNRVRCSEFFRD